MGGLNLTQLRRSEIVAVYAGDRNNPFQKGLPGGVANRYYYHLDVALRAFGMLAEEARRSGRRPHCFFGGFKNDTNRSFSPVEAMVRDFPSQFRSSSLAANFIRRNHANSEWKIGDISTLVAEGSSDRDVALFIFGHGAPAGGVDFIPPSSGNGTTIELDDLLISPLSQLLDDKPSHRIFVYVNACYGGAFAEALALFGEGRDNGVEQVCQDWNIEFLSPQDPNDSDRMAIDQFEQFIGILGKKPSTSNLFTDLYRERFNIRRDGSNVLVPWMYPPPNGANTFGTAKTLMASSRSRFKTAQDNPLLSFGLSSRKRAVAKILWQ